MAALTQNLSHAFQGLNQLPMVRQVALMAILGLTFSIGLAVFLWTQSPGYTVLYSGLSDEDTLAVVDALKSTGIDNRLDERTGAILVPRDEVHRARLQLAGQGLPKASGIGFEMLQKDQGFGTSSFMETARFHRALEGELARSVKSLSNIRSARVHLAVPKQSAFIRKQQQPTASVVVNLYPGRSLEGGQVDAITNLVAASIPALNPANVKVIDHMGRLLSGQETSPEMARTNNQFEYTKRLEDSYVKRIEAILTPIIGVDSVRAQVVADVDFTVTERTSERFNPDLPSIRSEQVIEEQSTGAGVQGVPGALTNQPPGGGTAPEVATQVGEGETSAPQSSTKRSTRNYELDKTISHTRLSSGELQRLSVAVVVDDKKSLDEEGSLVRETRTEQEITRLTDLVREAVGYDAQRGDTVNVVNVSFVSEAIEAVEVPMWETDWFRELFKLGLFGLGALLLLLLVLRPMLRNLTQSGKDLVLVEGGEGATEAAGEEGEEGEAQTAAEEMEQMRLSSPESYDKQVTLVKQLVKEDPKRVAQVIKNWVLSEGD